MARLTNIFRTRVTLLRSSIVKFSCTNSHLNCSLDLYFEYTARVTERRNGLYGGGAELDPRMCHQQLPHEQGAERRNVSLETDIRKAKAADKAATSSVPQTADGGNWTQPGLSRSDRIQQRCRLYYDLSWTDQHSVSSLCSILV